MAKTIEMTPVFKPTSKMQVWVAQRVLPDNVRLSDHALLQKLGFSKNLVWTWKVRHGAAWEVWAASTMGAYQELAKALLKSVGMRKALAGDYKFWRDLAVAYGLIPAPRRGRRRRSC
jgi:hypothetical protein